MHVVEEEQDVLYCSAPGPATGGLPVTPSRSLGFGMVKGNQTIELLAKIFINNEKCADTPQSYKG